MSRIAERTHSPGTTPEASRTRRAVATAIDALAGGRPVLLIHNHRDAGYLVATAAHVTSDALRLMLDRGRGVLRAAMTETRMKRLGLAVVAESASDQSQYAPSVDLTGHDRPDSMEDRAASARALAQPSTGPADLTSPGHLFPVRAADGGVLASPHVPEAVLDLARRSRGGEVGLFNQLADQAPLAGTASDPDARARIGRELGVSVLTIRELITEQEREAGAAQRVTSVELPTREGLVQAIGYRALRTPAEDIIAFVEGDPRGKHTPVHVHLRCPVSDVFGGLACRCGEQLTRARAEIARAGHGVILYSSWGTGRTLGHFLDELGDTTTAGSAGIRPRREREIAAVLRDLAVGSVRFTSNEPVDTGFLSALGIHVTRG